MNLPGFLFAFLVIPSAIFAQANAKKIAATEKKSSDRESINFYLENTNLSRNFSNSYVRLIDGGKGYTEKDTVKANKLIKRLHEFDKVAFYRLMRIRLEWEYKQRLQPLSLDSVKPFLKNNIDSAFYCYTKAILFKDSMGERMARKLGYVRVNYTNEEVPVWKSIMAFKWGDSKKLETLPPAPEISYKDDRIRDSAISYYKKAIKYNPKEFHHLMELVFFLTWVREEALIQEIIPDKLDNYTAKEKTWLKKYLANFYLRQNEYKK